MNFLKDAAAIKDLVGNSSAPEEAPPAGNPPAGQAPSTTELLSGAKYLAEAAQQAFSNQGDQIDKAKAANAAGDLLEAAKGYGNLDEKGFGKYIDQAQSYLDQYGGTASVPKPANPSSGEEAPPAEKKPESAPEPAAPSQADEKPEAPPAEKPDSGPGGDLGGYMKLAQQFMK